MFFSFRKHGGLSVQLSRGMDVSEPLHILKKLGKHIGQKSYKTQEMLRHGLTVHYAHRIYVELRLQKYPESRKSIDPTHAF